MKKSFKRTIGLLMALLMLVLCLSGCGNEGGSSKDGFRVTMAQPFGVEKDAETATFARWEALSEVPITWDLVSNSDAAETIKLQFSTGDLPEVVIGNYLQTGDISKYAANGLLLPLDEYINEKDTPNLYKLFENRPKTKAANYLPDGHMYTLPQVREFEAAYLENAILINKVWLDKLNLEVPTTLDELKVVLEAFKTKDPNGNGKADEIPMSFNPKCGYAYPEALLSCWGVATKYGTFDGFCTVQNGKVKFAPMMDEWKEMILFYNDLYSKGLLDMEVFTHNTETFSAKLKSSTSTVGVIWYSGNPMGNADEYINIGPLRATDRDPVWRIHPGIIGNRNMFVMTTACKNPKAVMSWIDKFYDFEESVQNQNGNFGQTLNKEEDGTVTWNEPTEGKNFTRFFNENLINTGVPSVIYAEDIGTRFELHETWETKMGAYELYKDYLDTETWPRPYYTVEETSRYGELTTDIFNYVDEKKAKWIVGKADVEAEWDEFKAHLKKLGVEEFLKINQAAYDRYLKQMK